ncbi:alkene reductase [Desulfovibrio inopinatus]|uniref:alkene reductase n=1 Tax=Desulfovibrio inopinatus TaxID=102109 RepID=UPI0004158393|nr:alkene reductase [Desulfovibrio inopinatus]
MSDLFSPFTFKDMMFRNHIAMPPMTRCRSSQPGNIPNAMMATYYGQRTQAGLIITEATLVSPDAQGYSFTPGIHSPEQVEGWKLVTNAVHERGGTIFVQLWHVGRMSHAHFHNGQPPVAPSAIATPDGTMVWMANEQGQGELRRCTPPRALTLDEIARIQDDFAQAAKNAKEAGFDGVELHAANGYLIDQFLRKSSNHRDDAYGESPENRIRFLIEIAERIVDIFPDGHLGVRFAPHNQSRGMNDPDTPETVLLAMKHLADMGFGYVHFAEADWDTAPEVPREFRALARAIFPNLIIVAGNYTLDRAQEILENGYADFVAFGRPFVANPDLPTRLKNGWPLVEPDRSTLYGGDEKGYIDYPEYQSA